MSLRHVHVSVVVNPRPVKLGDFQERGRTKLRHAVASIYMAVREARLMEPVSIWRASTHVWHQSAGETHVSQSGCTCDKNEVRGIGERHATHVSHAQLGWAPRL